MMNFKDIDYFLAIAKCRSFSRAAEQLYIVQPALSRHISQLEEKLGVKLFDRSRIPLTLTPAGKRYYEYAEQIQNLVRQLTQEFTVINNLGGRVRLGVPQLLGNSIIPKILPEINQKYPGIELMLTTDNTEPLKNLLINGKLDIAILSSKLDVPEIESKVLIHDPIFLAVHPEHPVAIESDPAYGTAERPLPIHLTQLLGDTFILLPPEKHFYQTVNELFSRNSFSPLKTYTVPNMNIAMNLVSNNMGVTFILRSVWEHYTSPIMPFLCTIAEHDEYLIVPIAYQKKIFDKSEPVRTVLNCILNLYPDHAI